MRLQQLGIRLLASVLMNFFAIGLNAQVPDLNEAEEEGAYAIGLEAFQYGYPRVEMWSRIQNETRRVSEDQTIFAPANHFYYFDRLARPSDALILKAANNDTLYASAYLDLSKGPIVLRIPPMEDRYYVALVVDAAGRVDTRIGSKVTGKGDVDLVFAGPGEQGSIPVGMKVLHQTTNDLWMLMRVACSGGKDEQVAAGILKGFTLSELASVKSRPAEGFNVPVKSEPIVAREEPFETLEFYRVLDLMLQRNPVPPDDRGLLARWELIGLDKGSFDAKKLSSSVRHGLERALVSGTKIVSAAQFGIANEVNGWNYSDKIGRIRNDWALNAAIARGGYGNRPEDSVYHQRNLDDRGEQLSGDKIYRITFNAGELPPVGAFWSITAYDQKTFGLIENPIRRYSIGDRTPELQPEKDGSLTITIQANEPTDAVVKANWLPVGKDPFYLIMRSYDPDPRIASGKWAPPAVKVVE